MFSKYRKKEDKIKINRECRHIKNDGGDLGIWIFMAMKRWFRYAFFWIPSTFFIVCLDAEWMARTGFVSFPSFFYWQNSQSSWVYLYRTLSWVCVHELALRRFREHLEHTANSCGVLFRKLFLWTQYSSFTEKSVLLVNGDRVLMKRTLYLSEILLLTCWTFVRFWLKKFCCWYFRTVSLLPSTVPP